VTRAVDRTFDILEVLAAADDAVSFARIREEVEIAPATVHRLLQTMVRRGYAAQDRRTRHYGPGPKLLEVAARSTTNGNLDLRRIAVPCLRKLTAETGETSNLILPYGTDEVVYIEQVKSPQMVSIFTEVGYRAPLHCTAAGKAILADLSSAELDAYLKSTQLKPSTKRTLVTPQKLVADLEDTRRRGFAIDDEEREYGVRCAAAPVLDYMGRCMAAISVSGPSTRISYERAVEKLGPSVRQWANRCSARLGYGGLAKGAGGEGEDTADLLPKGLVRAER
jgi:IclR family acetate operon transcriptional repressor